jgi:GNAT superfamily N-acetyltransferase
MGSPAPESLPPPAPPEGVTLRPGTRADAPAVVRLWADNDELDEGMLAIDLVLDHLFGVASVVVAEAGGAVVGFAATVGLGSITHLTDLFVARERQGQGIGRALLAAAFGGAVDRTTFASADARALPSYVRAGMRPWWPNLYLEVSESALGDLAVPADGEVVVLDPAAAGAAGVSLGDADRTLDFAYWARRSGALLFALRLGGRPAAVGAAATRIRGGTGAQLLRLRIAPDADPVAPVLATLHAVHERLGSPALALPGPHPALRPLLEAGARILDRDTFMASSPELVDPERLLPHPAFL